jgi:Na+/H+ antiporter NhaD/arsenite permease-like protein
MRSMLIVGSLMVAFLVGLPVVSSACVAAGLLLISRVKPEKLLHLDWELLAFFGGLFVVTGVFWWTVCRDRCNRSHRPW